MDLLAIRLKSTSVSPLLLENSFCERPVSWRLGKTGISFRVEHGRVFEIRVLGRKDCCKGYQPFVVRAKGKKNNHDKSPSSGNGEQSIPEGDGVRGNKSDTNSEKSHRTNLDWREFRAKLYRDELVMLLFLIGICVVIFSYNAIALKGIAESDAHNQDETLHSSKPLSTKWAHPIPVPEAGCVLMATEKLDGVRTFERTVVLLLKSGTRHPQEGPFGVVINRPLHKKIKHMKPTNVDLATTFSDCSLHFGGPLEASTFLLKTGERSKLPGFQEVIPGLCFGARNSFDDAVGLVKKGVLKPQDFRFFVGYAGWQLDQLREEIESNYWYVAACSSSLLCRASSESSESLWEEILQLMGGHYSELSRKPKQDM